MYADNTEICEELFAPDRRSITVLEFMLNNKADAAFEILDKKGDKVVAPEYIQNAITWING